MGAMLAAACMKLSGDATTCLLFCGSSKKKELRADLVRIFEWAEKKM
jgi:hypothetical protein